jgi:flagellar biosynthesis protein FlhF
MRLKSYFAATVQAALNLARQELGPDAMLVDSRRTGLDTRHLGDYEVVCAILAPKIETAAAADEIQPAPPTPFRSPSLDRLSRDVSELKRHMEHMAATIARSTAGLANLRSSPELAEAFAMLTAAEVDATLAHDLVAEIAEQTTGGSNLRQMLSDKIEKLFPVDPTLGRASARQKVVALVGPPGCGKTTVLVKLAAQYGLTTRKPTQILTLDTYRVAAADQLRCYAAILGVAFQVVETSTALAQSLEECKSKDLILIDTPGFSRQDMPDAVDMARFLSSHRDIDTHLVLPASFKGPDLKRITEQYEIFRPAKLLFTRLDETESFGSILNTVVSTGKPVSFLSSGQQVPEDLSAASKEFLARLVLRKEYPEENVNSSVAAA